MAEYTTEFTSVEIPSIFNIGTLEGLRDILESLKEAIDATAEVAKTALEAAKLFLIEEVDPLAILIDLLVEEINNLIQGLIDTGVFYAQVLPSLATTYSLSECLTLLGTSATDIFDPNRPITSSQDEVDFACIIFTARLNSLSDLSSFIEKINIFLDISPVVNIVESVLPGEATTGEFAGQSEKPDWDSVRMADQFPYLKGILENLQSILNQYRPRLSFSEAIDELITVIEIKQAQIDNIVSSLDLAINALIAVDGLSLDVGVIEGTGTQETLSAAIFELSTKIPEVVTENELELIEGTTTTATDINQALDDIGVAVAVAAVGPDAPSTLLSLIGL